MISNIYHIMHYTKYRLKIFFQSDRNGTDLRDIAQLLASSASIVTSSISSPGTASHVKQGTFCLTLHLLRSHLI